MNQFKSKQRFVATFTDSHSEWNDDAYDESIVRENLTIVEVAILQYMVDKSGKYSNFMAFTDARQVNLNKEISSELKGYVKTLQDAKFNLFYGERLLGVVNLNTIVLSYYEGYTYQQVNSGRYFTYEELIKKYL